MLTNSSLTIYHKSGLDIATHLETWVRYNYEKVWFFDTTASNFNKGYDDANSVQVRIPYEQNNNIDIENFKIGDIIVQGNLQENINSQNDLKNYKIYNITAINNNVFGNSKHIHLIGK